MGRRCSSFGPARFVGVLLATALAAAGASAAAADPGRAGPPEIRVSGHGHVEAVPDVAFVRAGVWSDAREARDAMAQNSQAMKRVIDALRQAGVAERDLQTEQLDLSPRYRSARRGEPDEGPQLEGYRAQNAVRATVRDISKVGAVLDAAVSSGANRIDGVSFGVADPAPLLERARTAAMGDARRRAETLAAAEKVRVGPVRWIEEGPAAAPGPRPEFRQMAAAEAAVPIAPGQLSFEVQVRVAYEIQR